MTDYFDLLELPRKPWLDQDQVKESFISKAAEFHPDRFAAAPDPERNQAQQHYTLLNEAQLCLSETRTRIRHLLELERGAKVLDLQEMPDDLVELFKRLTHQFKTADQFLKKRASTRSPLLQVALFGEAESVREELEGSKAVLIQRKNHIENFVKQASAQWPHPGKAAPAHSSRTIVDRLETSFRILSFVDRWLAQIQNRLLQLMV